MTTTEGLSEEIPSYVHLWNDPTFCELLRNLPQEARGNLQLFHPDIRNAVLTGEVSETFIEAFHSVTDRVEIIPLGRKPKKGGYNRPTFVLVELRLTKAERQRRGRPTHDQILGALRGAEARWASVQVPAAV